MTRLIASLEAILLLLAAAVYAAAFVGMGFMSYLAALDPQILLITGLLAVAAIACVILALNLIVQPSRRLMILGALLILAAIIVWLMMVQGR